MTHRLTHSLDTSARIAAAVASGQAAGRRRYGASWIAYVAGDERPVQPTGEAKRFGRGDRGNGGKIVSAGDGSGGRTR